MSALEWLHNYITAAGSVNPGRGKQAAPEVIGQRPVFVGGDMQVVDNFINRNVTTLIRAAIAANVLIWSSAIALWSWVLFF